MALQHPFQVIGYHSCDKEIGLAVLNGEKGLKASNNSWDWLGEGIYFWEQNPLRALEYGTENANGKQFNKKRIKVPFVLGAIIELGVCLNLMEPESISLLEQAHKDLALIFKEAKKEMPVNVDSNRRLDCAVLRHLRKAAQDDPKLIYDTVRCAFGEGDPIYPGTTITARNHIQVCVLKPEQIRGYFLPRPVDRFNPYLHKSFDPSNSISSADLKL